MEYKAADELMNALKEYNTNGFFDKIICETQGLINIAKLDEIQKDFANINFGFLNTKETSDNLFKNSNRLFWSEKLGKYVDFIEKHRNKKGIKLSVFLNVYNHISDDIKIIFQGQEYPCIKFLSNFDIKNMLVIDFKAKRAVDGVYPVHYLTVAQKELGKGIK